ncbi:hypothetical protein [Motiliproteus sp.]|uniref:hypothetical protein n=1 Tax=Motiliproteus sp. TaxID=1898955 RepID=UPI003BAD9C5E
MFVIPMAGMSSRFFSAGYTEPKYKLDAHGQSLFAHSVCSFSAYFDTDPFLFIVRDQFDTPAFVETEAKRLGIRDYQLVILNQPTGGQAETVALGLDGLTDEPLYIFNIDTFRPNYRKPGFCDQADGYLETFIGSGKNWSNIEPQAPGSDRVIRTAEKQEISEFCCTGLYHWASAELYRHYYQEYSQFETDRLDAGELYIAPIYNLAIRDAKDIRYSVIDPEEVIFCGTPDEYQAVLKQTP